MEYEFRRNPITGQPLASFSMEHQVFGRWFSDELADDPQLLAELEQAIAALQSGRLLEWQRVGRDLTLSADSEQVRVCANVLEYESDELPEEDGLSLYDLESSADCGLEDFQAVLQSWQAYLAGN